LQTMALNIMSDTTITSVEKADLHECEAVIERGLTVFYEVGQALLKIRDERLYRAEFSTFEEYCRTRWDMGRNYTNKVIAATEIVRSLGTNVPKPTHESQVRPLAQLEPAKRQQAWNKAVTVSGGKPTAKQVEQAVRTVRVEYPEPREIVVQPVKIEYPEPKEMVVQVVKVEYPEPKEVIVQTVKVNGLPAPPTEVPEPVKQAVEAVTPPIASDHGELRRRLEDCGAVVKLAASNKQYSVPEIAKAIGHGERSVELFIARVRMLPWLTVNRHAADDDPKVGQRDRGKSKYSFTVDEELRLICEDRAPRPQLNGMSLQAAIEKIAEEIYRRRKENNEKYKTSKWNPENIRKGEMKAILDWTEKELATLIQLMSPSTGSDTTSKTPEQPTIH